ncbi:MAG: ThiF family adenylyltransferase [Methylococcales bacterium]|nr:ThiF family adenylyltransferase [Methylococcales bacterium]
MQTRQLVFTDGGWQHVRQTLFSKPNCEGFAFALARPCKRNHGLVYVVEHILELDENDYEQRSAGGITTSLAFSNRINQIAADAAQHGLVPVHLHSHPPDVENFSGYDDQHEGLLHQWLQNQGQPLFISVVQAPDAHPKARLWLNNLTHPLLIRHGLQLIMSETTPALPALSRQNAFGSGLRNAARHLQIGIVGVGGIGMLVAEQLVRAGFCRFVLVDHDRIEPSNLNRLTGCTGQDLGRFKVQAAKTQIQRICRSIGTRSEVHAFAHDIYTAPNCVKSVLRQCDVILALTDNELSRITCLDLAFDGGAEFLMAGVDIRLDRDGRIQGLFAEVSGAEAGRYCPMCTGRLDAGQASLDARRYVGGEVWDKAQSEGYIKGIPDPSVMSLNAMAAGALVLEIQRRVAGLGVRDLWQMDYQDGTVLTYEKIERFITDECGVCRA